MRPTKRLVVNTIAQYSRTIINALLSLYSTRLVLEIIGVSDYGIYNVVGSVVTMLSFLTNSISSTTQRFLSYNQRYGNNEVLIAVFSNCVIIHIILAIITSAVLFCLSPLLFNGFLNIPPDRILASKHVYTIVVLMLMVMFLTSPFRALLISRENIVFVSIVDVFDGILKVLFVIMLNYTSHDKLVSYACIMLSIQFFNLVALSSFDFIKYDECRLPRLKYFNWQFCKEVSSFAGWTLYGVACLTARTQGVALLLNKYYGIAVNAAYGLGSQVNSMIIFVCESLKNAIKPQTIKAEGEGDRRKMLMLSEVESKFSFILLSCITVPAIFEMPTLLKLWLKNVPEYSILFTRMFLIVSLCDTLTTGLGTANQAVGKVKFYNLVVFTIKFVTLPLIYWGVMLESPMWIIALFYIIVEALSSLSRLFVLRKEINLDVFHYLSNVFCPVVLPFVIYVLACAIIIVTIDLRYRFLLTFFMAIVVYVPLIFFLGLNKQEKNILYKLVRKK